MKKIILAAIAVCLSLLIASSCTYRKADNEIVKACDTLNLSYSRDIVPILRDNCYSCHSGSFPSSSISLDTFNTLKYYCVLPGNLFMRMIRQKDARPMPQPPFKKLDDCQINQIGAWINTGAPDN
jgi:hypothetical protein